MTYVRFTAQRGFALLEALIALVLILVGLVAISQLQSISLFGAGEGRARAEAAHLTQQKLEQLRNILEKSEFTALASGADPEFPGVNAKFTTTWTVTPDPDPDLEQHRVRLWTTWTDSRGVLQRFDLASIIAWDRPTASAFAFTGGAGNPISPTGQAQRGGELPEGASPVLNKDGVTGTYTDPDSGITYLTRPKGTDIEVILTLPPDKDGNAQAFTTISGRIYFDPDAGNDLPAPSEVLVRLSSEGECIYDNTKLETHPTATTYKYFSYTCYVGPDWYGNVGVNIQSTKGPNVCVGDSSFNNGLADGTTISAHPQTASVRTYRGFKSSATASGFVSTGVQGGTQYGTIGSDAPTAATAFVNHDFLLADLDKKTSCATQMPSSLFTGNAGAYVCINPDNDSASDQCPSAWPLTPTSGSGTVTYTLTVTPAGNGAGNVTSDSGGIACGANCSAVIAKDTVVVLTAAPADGSTFDGWIDCPAVNANGTCTVTMSGAVTVGATFNSGVNATFHTLSVGTPGGGSITSSAGGINCGSTCSATYAFGATVTLTATADSGQTFSHWSGDACDGLTTGTCTVVVNADRVVTAHFSLATSCSTTVAGSMIDKFGSVTASPGAPAGVCSSGVGAGNKNYSCTLTAPSGTLFQLRNQRTDGNASQNYDVTQAVTANCGTLSVNF